MMTTTIRETMLHCPKCQQTFEEGVQRFCPNDNARLLPVSLTGEAESKTSGVFTNVLKRRTGEEGDQFSSVPKFSQIEPSKFSRPTFQPPASSKIFKSDPELELDTTLEIESKPLLKEPLPQNVKFGSHQIIQEPIEIEKKVVELPFESETLVSADEPAPHSNDSGYLLGQTIKDRYYIKEKISSDENAVVYLAEDKTIGDKKVIFKVLIDESGDTFTDKIFAEERLSLSNINHENIVNVFETGKLPDDKTYLVTEYIEGKTVKDHLEKNGQFNALRAARIVRQAADALSEAHQNGVLHRNLKPEDVVLTVDANGMERARLTNFGASKEKLDEENLLYKSPEQVEGKVANFTSDGYSLAVIAYQMLTNRLPFNGTSVGDLLRAQREGLKIKPSDLRADLPDTIDGILEKALAFNPFDRFEKVRDFGDEFFSEIIINATLEADEEVEEIQEITIEAKPEMTPVAKTTTVENVQTSAAAYSPSIREKFTTDGGVKATQDLAWEKRSPEPPNEPSPRRNLFSILGVAGVLIILLGAWYYFINRPAENFVQIPAESVNQNAVSAETSPIVETNASNAPTPEDIETPPLTRSITPPPDSEYFQNSKENLRGDALRNFLGFTLYYPKDWKLNKIEPEKDLKSRSKFLDISKVASSGTPIEQFLVSYYNSKGTFKADTENFQSLVTETNTTLKAIVPNYEMVSKGEITINNGWRAFEVKFKGTGKTANGENITLWGRRMFVPTAIRGLKNGYVITMLATSLSKEVQSVDDVGVKGDLSLILETFEPNQNF